MYSEPSRTLGLMPDISTTLLPTTPTGTELAKMTFGIYTSRFIKAARHGDAAGVTIGSGQVIGEHR
jgi:hypothetical protein